VLGVDAKVGFNFVTECFFLTHETLHIGAFTVIAVDILSIVFWLWLSGYMTALERYTNLMQQIGQIQQSLLSAPILR
jgi:hypothetical protein